VTTRLQGSLALAAMLAACGSSADEPAPLVALVVLDSLHAARCGAWGHARDTTPALDALARDGVRFAQAHSQSSWTLPSVASLFTGLEQEAHGLRHLDGRLAEDLPLLAERFSAAGWRTQAVVQTPVLGSTSGLGRGFDDWRVLGFGEQAARSALALAHQAVARADGVPLFLYLHLAPPHMPYQAPAPFAGRFADQEQGHPAVDGGIESCRAVHELGLGSEHPDMRRLAALYDENVAFADALLADFVAGLGDRSDFLLVALSDHGEAFGQHGFQGHNVDVHQEMLHVPLVFHGRGSLRSTPRVVETPVSLLDVAPTLAELCGLPPWSEGAGRSLAPWLAGRTPTEETRELRFSSRYRRSAQDLALGLRAGDLKLVLPGDGGPARLYDLSLDPHETRDLAAEFPQLATEYGARLRAWHAARAPHEPAATAEQDAPLEAQLRSLGYAAD
jgi:arylsulfatase A-like enzyme